MAHIVELVIDAKAKLGEGPCWDKQTKRLYWVDIEGKYVHVYDSVTNINRSISVSQMIGAVVPRNENEVIVAAEDGFYILNLETEETKAIADPESHLPNNRFNDGKCDEMGRFWAGTMDRSFKKGQGALYCLDTDHKVATKWENVSISNGLAWSPDNRYMYYIDTPTRCVVRFDFDIEQAHISNPTTVISFSEETEGMPDGMTIDEEGMLWIAHWGGAQISRWDPSSGTQLDSISIPALNVTSCAFGGDDLSELFVTTARGEMTKEQLEKYPYTGGVFKVVPGIKGTRTYSYQG
ncbi:SMP-30/gluconolactonase/LRE family protein [Bacillus sp. HMF5848]|uniref:SMP-30/gluconolactonase/LRE family protein n=1 Tax=Bacillus sp. HMF5848 TaxID=2495421 RepID=UPI000F79CE40|nr:SMP-30/gluconolactonase/LRE family protein [Bacillus sp. HMF5848]RSK25791.1 SMP-30/gluconolactonase/LRE family protein [Bacillus sp. HMF5848]